MGEADATGLQAQRLAREAHPLSAWTAHAARCAREEVRVRLELARRVAYGLLVTEGAHAAPLALLGGRVRGEARATVRAERMQYTAMDARSGRVDGPAH